MSTVLTINATKSAEEKVFINYRLSTRQLAAILDIYATEIAEFYEKRGLAYPEQWFVLRGAGTMLERYCQWQGQMNNLVPITQQPDSNDGLPFDVVEP